MNCTYCEERLSDYLESSLSEDERGAVQLHLESCPGCNELLAGITEVMAWGKAFPVYEAPAWLPGRIVANTPRIARESWFDTLAYIWKWLIEPRTAMALFTATLVLGWMGNLTGVSSAWINVFRNPSAIYYGAQGAMDRAYGDAIRRYYRLPLVTQIQSRIEQLREIPE
jgi:anti-sigma factor RsiW